MEIHLLAIGTRMPKWIDDGFAEYSRRPGRDCKLVLKEIPSPRKSKSEEASRIKRLEGDLLMAAVPDGAYRVALDEKGKMHSTKSVAEKLSGWFDSHRRVAIIIGGADGLSDAALDSCNERWSLSRMTFPHSLVRVILAEQIYRAYSLLNNHPYHRE
ncbi:23S rRNA (pseudouridine(1915)-N(3))-methyltransferase RlmH [Chromatiales bacterium (ex Bugula neritina AB1)]|nr:23S rRNA (pseudouridine(1915)-N(3))-methyltransferase RlmH [Chromatiales bacterium (ex Bugula neritina AB1)]